MTDGVDGHLGSLQEMGRELEAQIAELRQAHEALRAERDLGAELGAAIGLEEALDRVLAAAMRLEGVDAGGVYLVDEDTRALRLVCHRGLPDAFVEAVGAYDPEAPRAELIRRGVPVYPERLQDLPGGGSREVESGITAVGVIPVVHESRAVAVLNLASRTAPAIPQATREALEAMASRIGPILARVRAEAALRESEKRIRALLDDLPVAVSETTPEGRILYHNAFAIEMMGYSLVELKHLQAEDLYVRLEDREALVQALEETGEHTFEIPVRRKDGQVIWVAGSSRAVRDGSGRVVLCRGYHIDVTERRRRETEAEALQALREEVWCMAAPDDIERVLAALGEALAGAGIEYVEYGINTVVVEGAVPQVRTAARTRQGDWHRAEVMGGPIAAALASTWRRREVLYRPDLETEDRLGIRPDLVARTGRSIRSVIDVPFSHGTVSANSERPDAFGERDVAFLRQVGEVLSEGYRRLDDLRALAESEARYRALVETPDLGVMLMLPDGNYLYVSPQVERLTGYRAQEFYADPNLGASIVHPDDVAAAERAFRKVVEGGGPQEVEFRWRWRGEGEYRWASQINYPVSDSDGRLTAVQAVIQDVTDRRRMREEQVRLERLRGLGEMAAGVSHNLNNMLTGIMAPAEMLLMRSTDEATRRDARTIFDSGCRARDLVQRLARSVRGDETEALRPVEVSEVVEEAVADTRPRWQDEAEARGTTIVVRTELEVTPPVRATRSGLHDALVNLVFNAVDALPEGGMIAVRSDTDGEGVWVEVADDGAGMDEETRKRAPEPFFTTKMTVGTGLGLSTVYGAVARWGGTVDLSSETGRGTQVRLNLPVWREEGAAGPVRARELLSRGGRILVVEDEEMVRQVLVRVLERRHRARGVATGQEALDLFEAGEYDLALIDLGLPGMAGDQVARELRRLDPTLATVLITGWDLEEGDPRRAPFDVYLQKPFGSLDAVEEAVSQALALSRRRREAGASS